MEKQWLLMCEVILMLKVLPSKSRLAACWQSCSNGAQSCDASRGADVSMRQSLAVCKKHTLVTCIAVLGYLPVLRHLLYDCRLAACQQSCSSVLQSCRILNKPLRGGRRRCVPWRSRSMMSRTPCMLASASRYASNESEDVVAWHLLCLCISLHRCPALCHQKCCHLQMTCQLCSMTSCCCALKSVC